MKGHLIKWQALKFTLVSGKKDLDKPLQQGITLLIKSHIDELNNYTINNLQSIEVRPF